MMEILYGRHAVLEALKAGRRRVQRVYLGQEVQQTGIVAEILAAARQLDCPVTPAARALLNRAGPVNHQGVVAEAEAYPYCDLTDLLAGNPGAALKKAELESLRGAAAPKQSPAHGWDCFGADCAPRNDNPGSAFSSAVAPHPAWTSALYLALDHLQDVQNLGTLLRTAEAMAVAGVLLPDRRSASITPAVVNSSAGAVEHLHIAEVGNLVQALERLKNAGAWIVGLDVGPEAVPLPQADLSGSIVLVVGAEGSGLTRLVRKHCDWLLAIPMYGRVASLNAAVAGSVALVAARQAHGTPGDLGARK